ncbi:MAG: HigA family addiction module antidote protein [Candidatus Omnitrophica bacterium]|nr:HigA family addiction module antidote protein [Candidatus Omnitrophota bacterium]
MNKRLEPVHPGDVLNEDFLKPLALSQNQIARDIHVPPRRINEIILKKRRVTADTALRLAKYFKTSPQFWMNLQSSYDLDIENEEVGDRIAKEVHVYCAV